jgi:formylglycine-generating enzyme required for sulfatase activity
MHGNVWEWCQDTWHSNYKGAPTDGRAWIDNNNQWRVVRGGSWNNNSELCRSAYRRNNNQDNRNNNNGFRVVCVFG